MGNGDSGEKKYEKIEAPSPEAPKPSVGVTHAIDISRFQPTMRWDAVQKNGFEAVVAKSVDGEAGVDAMFRSHAAAAKLRKMPFGAYAFNRFSSNPVKQAEHFVATAFKETRWLVADIEFDKSKTTAAKFGDRYVHHMDDYGADHSLKFLEHITKLTGIVPWIYLNAYHFVGFKNPERFLKYPCWISNYTQKGRAVTDLNLAMVHLPRPYKKENVIAWQYSSTHPKAKEITGDAGLDANLIYLSVDELRKLAAF